MTIKKRCFMLCLCCMCVVIFTSCGSKDQSDALDFSNQLSDLSVIREQKITEARMYVDNGGKAKICRATDQDTIQTIIDKIESLALVEVEDYQPEEGLESSELYLLNGNKVVYHFYVTNIIRVGKKYYEPKEKTGAFYGDVMGYCHYKFGS